MKIELFLASLVLTVGVVSIALWYLRDITRSVLLELCQTEAGAGFWLRVADVLALAGSLMLVLAFGGAAGTDDWVLQMRLVLGLALAGLFVTVLLVASSVWRNVPRAPDGRMAAPAADAAPEAGPAPAVRCS
jgi:hypothetical protein